MPTAKLNLPMRDKSWPEVYSPLSTVARWARSILAMTAWLCCVSSTERSMGTNTTSASKRSTM
jgi:hypothetical protein